MAEEAEFEKLFEDPVIFLDSNNVIPKHTAERLGDILRNETVRSDERQLTIIPWLQNSLIQISRSLVEYPSNEKSAHLLEIYRVIINLLADNDRNRAYFCSNDDDGCSEFWSTAQRLLSSDSNIPRREEIQFRIVLMLLQFVRNTKSDAKYVEYLYQVGIVSKIFIFLRDKFELWKSNKNNFSDLLLNISEFLSECLPVLKDPKLIDSEFSKEDLLSFLSLLITLMEQYLTILKDSLDSADTNDLILYLSKITYYLTLSEEDFGISNTDLNKSVLRLNSLVPKDLEDYTTIKRMLFTSTGNIASMKSYNVKNDLIWIFKEFGSTNLDLYQLSGMLISVGNYITSNSRKTEVLTMIENYSTDNFFSLCLGAKYNDIILFQSYFLLSKLITENNARFCIRRMQDLIWSCKIIVDNSSYYKDVAIIYFKFIKNLLLALNPDEHYFQDFLDAKDFWLYLKNSDLNLETNELYLILFRLVATSQHFLCQDNLAFIAFLVDNLLQNGISESGVPSWFILEKIKTFGIVIQKLEKDPEFNNFIFNELSSVNSRIVTKFQEGVLSFLRILERILSSTENNSPEYGIIRNNSKFLCASTKNYYTRLEANDSPNSSQISNIIDLSNQLLKF